MTVIVNDILTVGLHSIAAYVSNNVAVIGPVCAQECCRINAPRFSADGRNIRLNQGSFVLLFFLHCLLFWAVFSLFIVCIFNFFSVLYFPA